MNYAKNLCEVYLIGDRSKSALDEKQQSASCHKFHDERAFKSFFSVELPMPKTALNFTNDLNSRPTR
jgi:hypothetical protein